MAKKDSVNPDRAQRSGGEKRSYEPPRVVLQQPIESVAAVCTPTGKANVGACPMGPVQT